MSVNSILNASIEELEQILVSNQLGEFTLLGLDQRPDFNKLFKHRANPKYIAQALLKEKLKDRILAESPDIKSERLALRKAELELKEKRTETSTQMQQNIYRKLQELEAGQMMISSSLHRILQALEGKAL